MKYIIWKIQRISMMLEQYAVEIPTLPVNLCLSRHIQSLRNAKLFYRNAEPQR